MHPPKDKNTAEVEQILYLDPDLKADQVYYDLRQSAGEWHFNSKQSI